MLYCVIDSKQVVLHASINSLKQEPEEFNYLSLSSSFELPPVYSQWLNLSGESQT